MKNKQKLKIVTLSFLLPLCLISCTKIGSEKINGIVIDDSTSAIIQGATVGLYDYHDYSIHNLKLLEETETRSDGTFYIKRNLRNGNPYALIINKDGYFTYFHSFQNSDKIYDLSIRLRV